MTQREVTKDNAYSVLKALDDNVRFGTVPCYDGCLFIGLLDIDDIGDGSNRGLRRCLTAR
jgi:hypothetical protein